VQGSGNGRGAARTRYLKLGSAPTPERTGDRSSSWGQREHDRHRDESSV